MFSRSAKNAKNFFPPKKNVTKKFLAEKNVTDFFQILEYKNFLILKMNIFLDFSFSKKQ
jgi:hypothetical protein